MSEKYKVLVVDDNESVRLLLKTKLSKSNFDVYCAKNVLEAFCKFIEEPFDLVLTDICMPGVNGNNLARYIRNLRAKTPIIAVTASPGLANEIFDMVIEKPFGLKFLLDTVSYFLPGDKDLCDEHKLQLCI
ncbi:MAG: response regulator [Deltaproteobacteria bacterium]|jgi:two-component system response regulator ResD|nr:response regulator [Deltaproteobacteria bacterium]MBW2510947.1 response regulator [Deltaproteobacteria bacterium]